MVQRKGLGQHLKDNYYSTSEGVIRRLKTYRQWEAHRPVGSVNPQGYLTMCVLGRRLSNHRVVYFLTHGEWPDLIDHIDGDKLNNSVRNLRVATRSENAKNIHKAHKDSESGHLGVLLRKDTGKYSVRFQDRHLGCFSTVEEAVEVYGLEKTKSFAT